MEKWRSSCWNQPNFSCQCIRELPSCDCQHVRLQGQFWNCSCKYITSAKCFGFTCWIRFGLSAGIHYADSHSNSGFWHKMAEERHRDFRSNRQYFVCQCCWKLCYHLYAGCRLCRYICGCGGNSKSRSDCFHRECRFGQFMPGQQYGFKSQQGRRTQLPMAKKWT